MGEEPVRKLEGSIDEQTEIADKLIKAGQFRRLADILRQVDPRSE